MKKTIRYAFVQSLPILCGYLFLGMAFGLLLQKAGYNFIWAFFISLTVYAGSGQFLLISFLSGSVSWFNMAFMTFMLNSRHIFYGLSFIERFQAMGKAYPYMIFSLTDETYSVLCSLKVPDGIDEKKASFFIALFDHCYWICGGILGTIAGELIPFDTTGVDFAMTALFVVIFIEQWLESKNHIPVWIGGISSVGCLCIFGADNFILPSLVVTVSLLLMAKKRMIVTGGEQLEC